MNHSFPIGWYVPFLSKDLKVGEVKSCTFFNQKLVAFRTHDGKACISSSVCPHVGADLSKGKVVKEGLRCPFHGFCFNSDGQCNKTYVDDEKPPSKAKLSKLPLIEKNGLILVYFHPNGLEPDWNPTEFSATNYTPVKSVTVKLNGNVQDIAENGADFIHMQCVHQFEGVKLLKEPQMEGPYLSGKFGFYEGLKFLKWKLCKHFVEFDIRQAGLGYAHVETQFLGIKLRTFTLPTPVAGNEIKMILAVHFVKPFQNNLILRTLVKPLYPLINWFLLKEYKKNVQQDVDVWDSQTHIDKPILSKSDLYMAKFRQHVKQFYVEPTNQP